MAHPQMYDDDDPSLARVRAVALRLPSAGMKVSHGRPAFFTAPRGKVFAYYGGSLKVDDEWVQHERSVLVLLEAVERAALLEDPRVFVPAYLGPSGWVGLDLPEAGATEGWDEVAELVDASFRRTASAKLVARLETASGAR